MRTFGKTGMLAAGGESAMQAVLELLEKDGYAIHGNPDLYARAYDRFGIADAQDIRARAQQRAFSGRRIFVIAFPAMPVEAQNALLKTLEEPPADALFVLITPSPQALLATVRSRLQVLRLENGAAAKGESAFLRASRKERLELLKPILEKGDDDRYDLGGIFAFLADLERSAASAEEPRLRSEALRAVYAARQYAGDRGALVKPLLESAALLIPEM